MKLNLKNSILSVIVLASLVGCGSDGGGGNGNGYGNFGAQEASYYMQQAKGRPTTLKTADQLSQAIVNNNFQRSSTSGLYPFSKNDAQINNDTQDCDEIEIFGVSLGEYCTYGSSSSSITNSDIGIRRLNYNGGITRNVTVNGQNFTFSADSQFGNSLRELASYLANKVQEADANGTLMKYVYDGFYPYKDGMCTNGFGENFYTQRWQCDEVANVNSSLWKLEINGKEMIIDLSASLIQQPTAREYGHGFTAY